MNDYSIRPKRVSCTPLSQTEIMDLVVRRNRPDTVQRIIEALEAVIIERGLEGISVNYIAEKADVSKVLIYRYFGSLDSLLEHFIKSGKLFPILSPESLLQMRPQHKSDLARIWYGQVIHLYRSFRRSKVAPELLKATFVEKNAAADIISKAIDEERIRLVNQLSFIEGPDNEAISAVILGGMSYMTILAQQNRPMMGLDLRKDENWLRIEGAVKLMCLGLSKLAATTETVSLKEKAASLAIRQWL